MNNNSRWARSGPPKIFAVITPRGMTYRATTTTQSALRAHIEGYLGNPHRLGRVPMPAGLGGWVDAHGLDKPHLPLNTLAMDVLVMLNGPSHLGEEETILGCLVVSGMGGLGTEAPYPLGLDEEQMTRLDRVIGQVHAVSPVQPR